jgi:hypothetical protein
MISNQIASVDSLYAVYVRVRGMGDGVSLAALTLVGSDVMNHVKLSSVSVQAYARLNMHNSTIRYDLN